MTSNIELYEKLLEKYRVSAPLPEKSRKEVLARKRNLYKRVMKRTGAYSIVIAMISYLFFALRKKGIALSFFKSAVITATAAATLTFSAAGGLYTLVKRIKAPDVKKIKEIEKIEEDKTAPQTTLPGKNVKKTGDIISNQKKSSQNDRQTFITKKQTLKYHLLKAPKNLTEQAALLTGKIINSLKKQNKDLRLIPAGQKSVDSSGTILIGSLEPDGKNYSVNTKLVDVKSARVIFMNSFSIPLNGDLDKSAETIAKSISGMLSGKINKGEKIE